MCATRVAIVDSGGANIASVRFALERLGAASVLTTDPDVITAASHVILPGVGAAAVAMELLETRQLTDVISQLTQPVLGICLGMQLLARSSSEDEAVCLGVFPCAAEKLQVSNGSPVPNTGWCRVTRVTDHPLLDDIANDDWFYFVHSYALPVGADTVATARHSQPFSAILSRHNYHATQFHPERSSTAGAKLLNNFLGMRT